MMHHIDRFVFVLLALLVLLSPIPLASNRDWSWTLCSFLAGSLTLAWLIAALINRRLVFARLHPLIPLLFGLAITWAWVQTQAWVPEAWKHPVWRLASQSLGQGLPGAISLAPEDNYTAIMRLLGYGLVFFLSFQLARDRVLARRALWWIFIAGVIYSVYGLLSYWGFLRELMWYQDDAFGRDVRATFVNRNHFANWAGLVIVCSIAAFFDHMLRSPRYPMVSLQSRQMRLDQFMAKAWAPLSGLILMVAALVLSHSRGGFIATFCGIAVLLFLLDRRQGKVSVRARAVSLSALAVSVVAFFITSEVLMERFDRTEVDAEGRGKIFALTGQGIGDNPLLGFGYGAYEDGFKFYRNEDITKLVDRAHNTFLENIFELGLPAALCLFLAVLGLLLICLKGVTRRHRDWLFPATGVSATVLVAVHATVDFGLQIPAVAILYAFVMGIACAQSFSSREGSLT
jgi:O-antigen ligase